MSYKDFYLSKKVASKTGFGRKVWILKLPRLADDVSSGRNLLGSLVEEIDKVGSGDYPLPYPMTTPQIFLIRLNELRTELGFLPSEKLILQQKIAASTISINQSVNLSTEFTGNVPGVPINLGLSLAYESITSVDIVLNEGAQIDFIPTDYMSRLARYFEGDDEKAFNVAVDVDDQLFVDLILIAKNYSLVYTQSTTFSPNIDAEIPAANAKFGGKLGLNKKSNYSLEVKLTDNKEYLIGFKTIDWDKLI